MSEMTGSFITLRRVLLALSIIGFVVPNAMVAHFLIESRFDVGAYFAAWVASVPATQLTLDLVIASVTFAVWSWVDAHRHAVRWWYVLPATFGVGICFAVPVYLLLRERVLAAAH